MPVIMGTAGHIDHGKTTLIKALTGTDCDRLAEEKQRGITIELGFAELRLPPKAGVADGLAISIVDVPGHERFVHTMVAGATGVDFILLVIAADEGVMPQTREHLDICSLLGISRGIVALTKIDAVDEELLALACEEAAFFLQDSPLKGAPIIPVSARTGQGMDALVAALSEFGNAFVPARSQDLFRIPVDRIFTMHGHGTVITGTMIAGNVRLGDTVQIYPGKRTSRVRGLQSHGGRMETALAGRRTAVNLPDLAVEDVHRGDVLSHPGTLFPSLYWAVWVTCLSSSPRPLRQRMEIHLHHGTWEIQARLSLMGCDKLLPGESGLAELRLPEEGVAVFGDRFVLRSFSPLRTVAGGVVLHPLGLASRRRKQKFAEHSAMLETLVPLALGLHEQTPDAIEKLVRTQLACTQDAEKGIFFDCLRVLVNLDSRVLEKTLASLMNQRHVFCFDKNGRRYLAAALFTAMADSCREAVVAYHERYPERQGIKRSELVSSWGKNIPPKLAHFVIEHLAKNDELTTKQEYLRLASHVASFSIEHAPLGEALLETYRKAAWAPPTINALLESLGAPDRKAVLSLLEALRADGKLVRVSEDIWYAAEHLESLEKAVRTWFNDKDTLDLAGFKTLTGLTRKHIIPLLEYFDGQKLTMRVGDARVWRGKG